MKGLSAVADERCRTEKLDGSLSTGRLARRRWSAAGPLPTAISFSAGPMVRIRFPPPASPIAPNGDIARVAEAGAPLASFDFGPRLDDGEEFYCILFRADFHVAQAIDEPLDEAPLPDGTLLHAREVG